MGIAHFSRALIERNSILKSSFSFNYLLFTQTLSLVRIFAKSKLKQFTILRHAFTHEFHVTIICTSTHIINAKLKNSFCSAFLFFAFFIFMSIFQCLIKHLLQSCFICLSLMTFGEFLSNWHRTNKSPVFENTRACPHTKAS